MEFHKLNTLTISQQSAMTEFSTQPQHYYGLNPAIALTTNFHRYLPQTDDCAKRHVYTRASHPNFSLLERQLALLHSGKHATVFASGMAAISAVFCSFHQPNSTIICSDEVYYEVLQCLETLKSLAGIKTITVDACDTERVITTAASTDNVSMIYLESANNPSSRMADLPAIAAGIKRLKRNIPIVVDNTWLSPALYRPLEHGADVVIESATKYISGRGDVILGAVIIPNKSVFTKYHKRIKDWRQLHGAIASPFNCWLISKALETLPLRMERICNSAQIIAQTLSKVPCISRVLHPSLSTHPSHQLATKLLNGAKAGVIFFHVALDSNAARNLPFIIHPIIAATSYGDGHTLMQGGTSRYCGSTIRYPGDKEAGIADIPGYWFRLAVGLQEPGEIIRALLLGLARYLTTPLGHVVHVYKKINVIEIDLADNSDGVTLVPGDVLVTGTIDSSKEEIGFYQVLEPARTAASKSNTTLLMVKVPPGIKPGIFVRKFQNFNPNILA